MTESSVNKVRTPLFPEYREVRQLLPIFAGLPKNAVLALINTIHEQTGTPQNPVDWSNPDGWIDERLTGDHAILARRIWNESNKSVNPRHIYGSYLFINGFELLRPDVHGIYQLTERGQKFLTKDLQTMRQIDDDEGMLHLLAMLATKTRAKRANLLAEWTDFLREYSKFGSESTIKESLRRRLLNLVERQLVEREGQSSYAITKAGLDYLSAAPPSTKIKQTLIDPSRDVLQAITSYNQKQRELFHERLGSMNPYQFERLIGDLLEALGYDDVEVTQASGDKGVDVVGTVEFGITSIREVVQVKRYQGSIGRPVLDQLRGALHYHKAIRGTIITTGKFTAGCKEAAIYPGAAPIGLIDGERLIELLIENHIGIKPRPANLYEIDEAFFSSTVPTELPDATL